MCLGGRPQGRVPWTVPALAARGHRRGRPGLPRPLLSRSSLAPSVRAAGSGRCRARAGARPLPRGPAAPSPRSARSGACRPSPRSLPGARRRRGVRGGRAGRGCSAAGAGRGGGGCGGCREDAGLGPGLEAERGQASGWSGRGQGADGFWSRGAATSASPRVEGGLSTRRCFPPLSPPPLVLPGDPSLPPSPPRWWSPPGCGAGASVARSRLFLPALQPQSDVPARPPPPSAGLWCGVACVTRALSSCLPGPKDPGAMGSGGAGCLHLRERLGRFGARFLLGALYSGKN